MVVVIVIVIVEVVKVWIGSEKLGVGADCGRGRERWRGGRRMRSVECEDRCCVIGMRRGVGERSEWMITVDVEVEVELV